jgi:hypothetical protein
VSKSQAGERQRSEHFISQHMNESGIWWVGLALLVLAVFPVVAYAFFSLVVLERKSQGLVEDLQDRNAFKIDSIAQQLKGPEEVKQKMAARYSYKRFGWPVLLLVFFNLVCFSIVWDLARHRFATNENGLPLLYSTKLLNAAELPMMAFLGVVVFNYGHILRRLYVWDVTTHVFWNALHRTWLVVAVAVVLTGSMSFVIPAGGTAAGTWISWPAPFFALGFIINPVLRGVLDRAQDRFQIKQLRVDELPLSLIQGMSFWHQYRLEEEGVENVQNLATCDLIDLAFATRYNLRTLLDWVDQAILIHRMGVKATKLREIGFISGAIDMAWASPQNARSSTGLPEQIAKTVETETIYVSTLMNSLYQDSQIHMLWDLWQSELDARSKEKF